MKCLYLQDISLPDALRWAETFTRLIGKDFMFQDADTFTETRDSDLFSDYLQQQSVDMLFIACENERRTIQQFLNACRSLRIPYIFLTDTMIKMPVLAHSAEAVHSVLAPVTMLEEEVHKAEYLAHLYRYTGCSVTLLIAKDYGSRAQHNADRIRTFVLGIAPDCPVLEIKAIKDSSSLHKELHTRQHSLTPDMLILTASREYGLDDLVFGPAERYAIRKSAVPVMLLNPRADLFSLCD